MGFFIQNTSIVNDGTIVPAPLDRDEKSIITHGLIDPVQDIDRRPLTFVNSRKTMFLYEADEKKLRQILPEPLKLEDDLVEFTYMNHITSNTGPYLEAMIAIAASCEGTKGAFYTNLYVPESAALCAGREFNGTPKKSAHISMLEHGQAEGIRYKEGENPGRRFFSFMIERNGYIIHSATGEYTSHQMSDLPRLPLYQGNPDWCRLSYRVMTEPDFQSTKVEVISTGSAKNMFAVKPDTIDVAIGKDIHTWALLATPGDALGRYLAPKEQKLVGVVSNTFNMYYPPSQNCIWTKTIHRTPEEVEALYNTSDPYTYTLRHSFPSPAGA